MGDWDTGNPGDSDIVSQFPANERASRAVVKAAFGVDHRDDDDADQGKHEQSTYIEQASDPSTGADEMVVYSKESDGQTELFARGESDGDVVQITKGGTLNASTTNQTPIGAIVMWLGSTPPSGFVGMTGQSIGDTGSGADDEDPDYEALYLHIWNSLGDTEAPVAGGRGASAAADWGNGKAITLPDTRGRSPIGAGSGGSLTERDAGETGGAETDTLTEAKIPPHTHTYTFRSGFVNPGENSAVAWVGTSTANTGSTGGGEPHNNMHPWIGVYLVIRYK